MRLSLATCLIGVMAAAPTQAQQQDPAGQPSICFTVIEGRTDVPPGAPILVDRCTGETFVLTRSRGQIAWSPIAKTSADRPETKAVAKSPAGPKKGCFSYSDRTYCP